MTAQDTENQAGGAPAGEELLNKIVNNEISTAEVHSLAKEQASGNGAQDTVSGNESAPTGAEATASAGESAPAADAAPASEQQASTAEPQPDAPKTPRDKLHDDAVAFIIAARLLGIDAAEYMKAKVEEIAD